MLVGIDVTETVEHVSKYETNTESPTVFVLRALTNRDKIKLFGSSVNSKGEFDQSKFQDKALDILKAGLKEVRNLVNKKTGQPETVSQITDEFIDALPFDVVMELFEKIMTINFLTESERKN
jgi:hypothetical protein